MDTPCRMVLPNSTCHIGRLDIALRNVEHGSAALGSGSCCRSRPSASAAPSQSRSSMSAIATTPSSWRASAPSCV